MPYPAIADTVSSYLQATLQNDAALKALIGGSAVDPRVYHFYQAEAELSGQEPAYLSWANLSTPRQRGAVTEPVFSIRIYAYNIALTLQIETRVRELFDNQVHTVDSRRTVTQIVQAEDLYDQTNKFAGREVHVQFGLMTSG